MTFTFLLLSLCVMAAAQQQTYQLVWSDEFNGNSLDLSKWQYEVNCDGGGNNELQCYTNNPGNLQVSNGSLQITALNQNYNGKQFTSARINTRASAAWKYGKIEFRAKMPYGNYLWPALWMMPRDGVYGGGWWAASGEIDIMEQRGTTNQVESTLHYGGGWPNNIYSGSGPQTMSFDSAADFHLYSAVWTPDAINFLIDNNVYYTENLNRNFWSGKGSNPYTSTRQPFDQYFYIIINMAMGGGFFGAEANSLTPDIAKGWANPTFSVDYVRVYQLQSSPVNVNPSPAPTPTTASTVATQAQCQTMFAQASCRTASEDPSQVDASAVANARGWLCSTYPQFCSAIINGGTYTSCNSVEQLTWAMSLYYNQYQSQGSSACGFGGVAKINTGTTSSAAATPSTVATPTPTTAATPTTSAGVDCNAMFQGLTCRTTSQDPNAVNAGSVSGARSWLCGTYPALCTAINTGGAYSSCNSVQQLSYAMNLYYAQFSSQGSSACNFGGVAQLVSTPVVNPTPAPQSSSVAKTPSTSSTPTPTTSTPSAPVTTASQANACPNGCGSGSCCNDGRMGGVCYNPSSASCLLDTSGKSYLCGAGSGVCSTHCYDAKSYICVNGGLQPKY